MSHKTTIVLLVVLAGAVGFIVSYNNGWFGLGKQAEERRKVESDRQQKDYALIGQPAVEGVPQAVNIVRLELVRGQDTLIATHAKDRWTLVEPQAMWAESGPLDSLVSALRELRIAEVFRPDDPHPVTDKWAGLDAPNSVLTLTDDKGRTYRLAMGKAVGSKAYVRVNKDKTIYRVDTAGLPKLDERPSDLRNKSLWDVAADQVRSAELVASSKEKAKPFTLARVAAPKDTWMVTLSRKDKSTITVPADKGEAGKLVGSLSSLRVAEWAPAKPSAEDLKVQGLDDPAVKVTVRLFKPGTTQPDDKPLLLAIGQATGDRGEKRFGQIVGTDEFFTLDTSSVKELEADPAVLRDKHPAIFAAADATSLAVVSDGGQAKAAMLTRPTTTQPWQMDKPEKVAADSKLADDVIAKIAALAADSFDDDRPADDLAKRDRDARLNVTLGFAGGGSPVALHVWPNVAGEKDTRVHVDGSPSAALVPAGKVGELLAAVGVKPVASTAPDDQFDPLILASKAVWSLDERAIAGIARAAKGADRAAVLEDKAWKLTAPIKMDADAESVAALLGQFAALQADRRTTLNVAAAGLDKPAVTLTFTMKATTQPASAASQPERHTLKLVKKAAKAYCIADDKLPVYLVSPAVVDKDAVVELGRRALAGAIDPAKVTRVELNVDASQPDQLVLVKSDDKWQAESVPAAQADPAVEIDPAKVRSFLDDLAGLKVSRYVDFNCRKPADYGLDKPKIRVATTAPASSATTAPDAGGVERVVLLVGSHKSPDDPKVDVDYVMVEKDGKVGVLEISELAKLRKELKDFKKVEEMPPGPMGMPPGMMMPPGMRRPMPPGPDEE